MQNQQGTRWERRKDARPEEIARAALQLFVERGYSATKMEDIAAAAGVTKGTPYLYYENKAEILKAVVRTGLLEQVLETESLLADPAASAADLLRTMTYKWWHSVNDAQSGGLLKLMIAEASNFPDLAQFYYDEVILRSRQMVQALLERGIASGEFRPDLELEPTIHTITAPIIMAMIWQHSFARFEPQPQDLDGLLANIHAILMYGLAASPSSETQ